MPEDTKAHQRTDPNSWSAPRPHDASTMNEQDGFQSVTVRIKDDTHQTPLKPNQRSPSSYSPRPSVRPLDQPRTCARRDPRAPPTYPFLAYATVKDRKQSRLQPRNCGPTG